jgi:hypothetical protein
MISLLNSRKMLRKTIRIWKGSALNSKTSKRQPKGCSPVLKEKDSQLSQTLLGRMLGPLIR